MKKIIIILQIFLYLFIINKVNANQNYGSFKEIVKNGKKYQKVINWNSEKGIALLSSAKYKNDFYQLASHFQPQQNALYCGIASTTIILNAFRQGTKKIPQSTEYQTSKPQEFGGGYLEFATYTQSELLTKKTDRVKKRNVIRLLAKDKKLKKFDPGLTLIQLHKIIKSYGLKSRVYYAKDNRDLARFKRNLKNILAKKNKFIIANFQGKVMGILSGGHISPIVAYNKKQEKLMVLDVASHKQSWWWGDINLFFLAMQEKDGNKNRGYLVVGE